MNGNIMKYILLICTVITLAACGADLALTHSTIADTHTATLIQQTGSISK
jgi:predicted small lipoprotein YifL